MKYRNILVTGGAGFVGSNICIKLKEHFENIRVVALDNLIRKGSELNIPRLTDAGVEFVKGDVRFEKDIKSAGKTDLLIECSAEPSVMAGVGSSPKYLIDTNLMGAANCFEYARLQQADVVFLSTSRVYPYSRIDGLSYTESNTRFEIASDNSVSGLSSAGIAEDFPLDGFRSMYGATKLSAEYLLQEYVKTYGMRAIINRFGVIAGPWQMGKVDQGFITHWLSAFIYDKPLSYFGYGGKGKQVRDVIHIDDVFDILLLQLDSPMSYSGTVWNVGGGHPNSISLRELTTLCEEITGKQMQVSGSPEDRPNDVKYYVSDFSKLRSKSGWSTKRTVQNVLADTHAWILTHKKELSNIFGI